MSFPPSSLQHSKLQPGRYYAFQLSSRNACGETTYPIQWFMTQASVPNPPSPPRSLSISNHSIEVGWDALDVADGNGSAVSEYILQVGVVDRMHGRWTDTTDAAGNVSTTTEELRRHRNSSRHRTTVTNLAARTVYAFRLCAHNGEGDSAFTPTVEFTTILGVAPPPVLLIEQCAKKVTSDSIWLRWTCDEQFADAVDRFAIRLTHGDWTKEVETTEDSLRINELLPGTTYR